MDNIKIKRWICDILLFLCFTAIAFFAGKILINQWKYKNRSFWKKHQKIILYLPKETRTLKVIAARANKPEKLPIEFKNKKDRENYLSRIQSISYLPDQSIRKRLYTFVTCSYEKNDYRTYIYAVENQKEVRE